MSRITYRRQSFQINNTIMPHLREDFKEDKQYELGFNKTNDYLVLKSNNKLYKIHKDNSNNIAQSSLNNTQESNPTQNNQNQNNTQTSNTQQQPHTDSLYLKENKDFEEIKTILELTEEEVYQGVEVWVEVRWKITLEMLRQVFEYYKANSNATRMDTMLPQMVKELNNTEKDDKPMYMHYKLDTRNRLEHFFAQCYVEVGGREFKLEEGLEYSVKGLVHTFSYYHTSKEKIKEALNDGKATQEKHYKVSDILSSNNPSANKAIQDFVQDYINTCTNALPKNNGVINQTTNIAQIEATLGAESKKKFDKNKDYSPIELIEFFKEYQSYTTIQLAFKHFTISLAQNATYDEIPYSTDSNKAFAIIAQALFNHIVDKRSDKNANEAVIGNKVYGNRYDNAPYNPNLTDQTQGDGYKYCGKGLIHLTWKENYKKFGEYATKQKWGITDKGYFFKNPLTLKNEPIQNLWLLAYIFIFFCYRFSRLIDDFHTTHFGNLYSPTLYKLRISTIAKFLKLIISY